MNTVRPRTSAIDTPIGRWPEPAVDGAAHIVEGDREIAGEAGHHRIGIAERQHAGGEHVAVVVDQALAVAEQKAMRAAAAHRGSWHSRHCARRAAH